METSLYLFPWNLADEGVEPVLEAVRDRAGCAAVSVAFNYHTAKFLHPRPHPHFHFAGEATAYFRAQLDRYRQTSIKPVTDPTVSKRDVLHEAREAARRVGLRYHAWIVCLHSTLLGTRHLDAVVRTAYGDPLPFALSPSHPEVREYVKQLVLDVALAYEPDALELESLEYVPVAHGYHHELDGVRLSLYDQALMGADFSPHAQEDLSDRGVDVERCMSVVRRRLDDVFSSSRPAPHRDEPELDQLFAARAAIVTDLVGEIVSAVTEQTEARVDVILSPWQRSPEELWLEGHNAPDLARHARRLLAPAYYAEPSAITRHLTELGKELGDLEDVTAILLAMPPSAESKQQLVDAVDAVRECGLERLSFYNYGFMRADVLDWIHDATR